MAKITHFKLGPAAQDRMKLPGMFWVRLKTMNLTPSAVLMHSGLPPTVYREGVSLTTKQLFALWRSIHELSRDSSLGWKGMQKIPSDQFHPALLAALNARNFRDSLQRLARYKQLCGAQEFQFTETDQELRIEVIWPFATAEEPPDLLLDAVYALIAELGRRGTASHLAPKRIELRRERGGTSDLNAYFSCPIKYQARRNVLVWHPQDIDRPFLVHNEELLQLLAPQLENQLKDRTVASDILAQVKWVLRRMLSGSRPDVTMVAKELGLSERTLQRRITDAGSTFRNLLNETRREQVRTFLADGSMEIAEAAFLLGYEDTGSFYRAFRSWEGKTPAEWRAAHFQRVHNRDES